MRGWVAPGRSLRYKRLQNRMSHHAIVSDFRVGDFSIKARLNPRRITLLERLWVSAFVQRLRELGWVEGLNVAIEYRWAEGRNERYTEIATEFVRLKVDLIVTAGASVVAAKQATSVIPIIFAVAADPLGTGPSAYRPSCSMHPTAAATRSRNVRIRTAWPRPTGR